MAMVEHEFHVGEKAMIALIERVNDYDPEEAKRLRQLLKSTKNIIGILVKLIAEGGISMRPKEPKKYTVITSENKEALLPKKYTPVEGR